MIRRRHLAIITVLFSLLTFDRSMAAGAALGGKQVLPLTLPQAVTLALQKNRPFQTSRRAIAVAVSNYRSAKAGYYPRVIGNLSSEQQLTTTSIGNTLESVQIFTGGLNITASMPLDLSGAIGRSVQQALISFVTAKANYVVSGQSLITQVYQEYYDILRSLEAVKIDQGQVDQAAEQLRIAQERLKTGRVPEMDILTAKVQLDNARQTLKVNEGALEIAKSQMRNTLVVDQNVEIIPTDRITFQPEKLGFDTALKEALENRVEIKSARLSLESARISLKSTYDPYLPTLSITGSYGFNIAGRSPSEAWQTRPREPSYAGGAAINVPLFIFDGGVIRESKVQALVAVEQAEANIKEMRSTVALEVKNNLTQLDNSRERVEIGQSSIDLARESLRIAEMRYSLGVASYLEFTDSRNNLRTAELNFLNALIGYNIAKINVYRVLGRPLINTATLELSSPLPSLEDEKKIITDQAR